MITPVLIVSSLLAQVPTPKTFKPGAAAGSNPDPACLQALETIYEKALSTALWGVGIACFFAIIFGGVKYMTAGGDDKAMVSAKQTITYGVLGLLIAVSAWAILFGINIAFLRVNGLIQFSIPGTC